jgi:hypothetical protein
MRRREALGDLDRVVDRLARGKRAARQPRAQGLAFEQLRDDVGSAIVRPEIVDRGDVGVVQAAGGLRLLLEAPQPVRVVGEGGRQDLDRDVALQALVARAIDLPHATGADDSHDLVRSEPGAGREAQFNPSTT